MKYLSIDVGTTRCKCQLFDDSGNVLEYIAKDYEFKKVSGEIYADADAIIDNVKSMVKAVAKNHEFNSVAVSSFGESFVLLDKDDKILFYPMLYTDIRGEEQARRVAETFGNDELFKITGITAHMFIFSPRLDHLHRLFRDPGLKQTERKQREAIEKRAAV